MNNFIKFLIGCMFVLFIFLLFVIIIFILIEVDKTKGIEAINNYRNLTLTLFGITFAGIIFKNNDYNEIKKSLIELCIIFLINTIFFMFFNSYFTVNPSFFDLNQDFSWVEKIISYSFSFNLILFAIGIYKLTKFLIKNYN